jgi:hypothetical protein
MPEQPSPPESPTPEPQQPLAGIPVVTAQDRENERVRQEIAERMEEAYVACWEWALKAFGPGWLPSGKHMLIDKDEENRVRYTSERPKIAATVYTVRKGDQKRHFTVGEDGAVTECEGYEQGFGPMLLEPHPTQTIEVRGQVVHPHRYSLCWGGFELYEPKTADELAVLRASRERKKKERETEQWKKDHPLLVWAGVKPPE